MTLSACKVKMNAAPMIVATICDTMRVRRGPAIRNRSSVSTMPTEVANNPVANRAG
jgi:hypothetical protein